MRHRLWGCALCFTLVASTSVAAAEPRPDVVLDPVYVVSVGDSYLAGEGSEWAGNGTADWIDTWSQVDTGSSYTGGHCHRNANAAINVGQLNTLNGIVDARSLNLACSGAKTKTYTEGGKVYPGLDFDTSSRDRTLWGQAEQLRLFAAFNRVSAVVVSIGGNDFGFAEIIEDCVTKFMLSSFLLGYKTCASGSLAKNTFTDANLTQRLQDIRAALFNIVQAMTRAGYGTQEWTLIVNTYPSIVAGSGANRLMELWGAQQRAQQCPLWNSDIDWANTQLLPTVNTAVKNAASFVSRTKVDPYEPPPNVRILDMQNAFMGRRVCEKGVNYLDPLLFGSWRDKASVDKLEWVTALHVNVIEAGEAGVLDGQEKFHPNAWGSWAERNCLRQMLSGAFTTGVEKPEEIQSGACLRDTAGGRNWRGEPNMTFVGRAGV